MSNKASSLLSDLVNKNVVLEESILNLKTNITLLQEESKFNKKILLEMLPLVKNNCPSIANPERFGDGSLANFEIHAKKYCQTYWIDILNDLFPAAFEMRFDQFI